MSEKGTTEYTGTFDVRKESPIDPRTRQETFAELLLAATWTQGDGLLYRPNGLTVLVYGDTEALNGYYFLPKNLDYSVSDNWVKVASGDGFKVLDIADISELDTMSLEQGIYLVRGAVYGQLTVITKQGASEVPSVGDSYEGSTVTAVYISNAECRAVILTADGLSHTVYGDSPTKPPALGAADSGGHVAGRSFAFDGSKYWKTIVASDSTAQLPFKPSSAPDINTGAHYAYASSTNTSHILSAYASYEGPYAAKYCDDLVVDGYSDWQLPTLSGLGDNIHFEYLPGIAAGTTIWSSDTDSGAVACVGRWDGTAMTIATSGDIAFEDKDTLELVLPTKVVQVIASSEISWSVGNGGNKQILLTGGLNQYREVSDGSFPAWTVMEGTGGAGDMLKATYDTNNNGKVDTAENAEKLGGTLANQFVQTNDSRLSDARPASDVPAWAKAPFKPEYTAGEVGAQPTEAGKGLSSNDYTTAEKNKLAAIDAAHYGAPLQSTAELAALTDYADKQRHYVEDDLSDYFYDAQATSGDIAPANQVGGIGWWKKVAVGGETAASIKAKYESNPDTNAYTNAEKSKLASITAIFTTELKSAYDAAASWVSTNGANVLSNITELFSRWTDAASTGFVKFDVEAGDCHSITGSTFNLLKSGYGRIKGTKVTFAAQSVAFPASYGLVFAKINSAGVLVTGGSVDYATEFPLFYLFTGVSGTYYVALESHNFNFNTNVSGYLHKAVGVQIVGSGGNVVVANTNTQVAISGNAELLDRGLSADITDTAGVGVVWIQDYLNSSGQWALNTLAANLAPRYNVAGTPTLLDSGKFGVYRLYATKQDGNTNAARYLAIMDTTQYSNQNAAQGAINANTVAAATGALISVEVAQIGFAIVRADGVVVATTVSKQTLTMQSASGSAATAAGTSLIPFDGITATNVQDGLAQENTKAIHKDIANEYSTITEKTTFADADVFLMEDSEAGFAKKKWTFSNFFSYFVNTKTVSTLNTTSKILAGAINEVRAGGINASAVDVSTWALGEERPIGARKNATTGAAEFAPNIGVIDVYALSTAYKTYLTTEANWLDVNGRPVAAIITGWGLQCQRYTTTDYVYECIEDNKWTRYPLVATLDIYNVPAAAITAITTAGNWTGVNYTGAALTGCWRGMRYVSATYIYEFYDDNTPCRTTRV